MNTQDFLSPCLCGSGQRYGQCCGPYIARQTPAPTAEALMRSRYTAFQLRDADYLRESWDPGTCSANLDFEGDERTWTKLEIRNTLAGGPDDPRGVVEFKAWFDLGDDTYLMHETSRFHRIEGRWVYLDGKVQYFGKIAHKGVILPKAPCPCGSGKKYKKCCG